MRNIYITIILSAGILITSCKKELNEDSRSQVTDEYLNTPDGFQSAVNGAYSFLRTYYGTELGGNLSISGTDEYTAGTSADRDYNSYSTNLNPTKLHFTTAWNNFYAAINNCNAVINRAPNITGIDEILKTTRVAEARFLRAQYYFMLVQMYGAVHLSLIETQTIVTTASRTPVADIYKVIIEDLDFAAANLPIVASNYGRATKPAVEHLLSKVYLTRGSLNNDQADFVKAAALANGVITNYSFKLLDDFAAVFAQGPGERNSEVIFSVQYSGNVLTNSTGNQLHLFFIFNYDAQPGMKRDLANGRPFIRFKPTAYNLNTVYNHEIDGRFDKTFKRVYYCNNAGTYTINGHQVNMSVGDTAIYFPDVELTPAEIALKNYNVYPPSKVTETTYPTLTKYLDPLRTDVSVEAGSRDFILFRLGETYLIAAEALLKAGRPDEAVLLINTLRRRAAKTGTTEAATAANKTAMEITTAQLNIDFILDERMRELNGEHQRWFDLVRTKQLVNRVKLYNPLGAANIKDIHMLRPVPQSQIDRTDGGLAAFPQNPGY